MLAGALEQHLQKFWQISNCNDEDLAKLKVLSNLHVQLFAVGASLCEATCLQHKLLDAVMHYCAMQFHIGRDA